MSSDEDKDENENEDENDPQVNRPKMPLPDLVEIVPLAGPVWAEITVPGSKSLTNRALVLAALANGQTTLRGALWSEDTEVMVQCLQRLGFGISVTAERREPCNRTLGVQGLAGFIPGGGSPEQPLELFVANAGTTARFLAAMVCLGKGVYRLHGTPRMHARPQAALFQALRQLGYRVESPNERLPVIVHGGGRRPGKCRVSVAESSQFASALLLAARTGGWEIEVVGENAEEAPYVAMTVGFARRFATAQGNLLIEPDASSGSYFWAAGWLAPASCLPLLASQQLPAGLQDFLADPQWSAPTGARPKRLREWVPALCRQLALRSPAPADAGQSLRQFKSACSLVGVADWPDSGWQVDEAFADYLPLPPELSRQKHLGDSILTAAVLAPLASGPTRFTDLGRLRLQECERVTALRTELSKCGAQVLEDGDTLQVFPGPLHGAEIETYNDHRLAMCFTILGLKVPGIKIKNPACVSKTFPDFFQKLAAAPPHGLGAEVREAQTGRRLGLAELFAEQSQSLLGPAAASSWGNESASRHCD